MTFHPQGNSCSDEWFHDDRWLDFNMYQSIRWPGNIAGITGRSYDRVPAKPVVNGEPFYFGNRQIDSLFNDRIFRSQPYWSFISGARGYPSGSIISGFSTRMTGSRISRTTAGSTGLRSWIRKVTPVGGTGGGHDQVTGMVEVRSDSTLITEDRGSGTEEVIACRLPDHSEIMVYFPTSGGARAGPGAGCHALSWNLPGTRPIEEKEIRYTVAATTDRVEPPEAGRMHC